MNKNDILDYVLGEFQGLTDNSLEITQATSLLYSIGVDCEISESGADPLGLHELVYGDKDLYKKMLIIVNLFDDFVQKIAELDHITNKQILNYVPRDLFQNLRSILKMRIVRIIAGHDFGPDSDIYNEALENFKNK